MVGNDQKNLLEKPFFLIGVCLLISTALLIICTKSSPLYPFNDWVDANAIFTLGKGMMNGRVPYRDLFETKGILLFFLQGLAYLVSNRTFVGVFLLEVFSFTLFLFFAYKTARLFVRSVWVLVSLPILAASILNLRSFTHGGSAEEYCLPLIIISLYSLLSHFKHGYPKPMLWWIVLLNGVIAGCVLWIKFSMLGFWLGWLAAILIGLLWLRDWRHVISTVLLFLAGMLAATLPWLIYFGVHHAIKDWFDTYILYNTMLYPTSASVLESLQNIGTQLKRHFMFNPLFVCTLLLGVFAFTVTKRYVPDRLNRFGLFFSVICLILGVYGGGRNFIYYFLIVSPFILLGFVFLLDLILSGIEHSQAVKWTIPISVFSLLLAFLYSFQFNHNTYMLDWKKTDLVQYQFAELINQTQDATLLNYGWLDIGVYTVTGITPNVRFFQNTNADYTKYPVLMDEQNRYIKEKVVDYLVMRVPVNADVHQLGVPHLEENYELIRTQTQLFEKKEYDYLLFLRKQ